MVSGMCERRLEAIEDIIVVNSRDTTYDQEFQRRQVKLIAELYRDEDPKHSPAKDSFEKQRLTSTQHDTAELGWSKEQH